MKKTFTMMVLVLVLGLIASACVPAPTPEPAAEQPAAEEPAAEEPAAEEPAAEEKVKIVWWSHWAEETNKRNFIEQVIEDYTAEHPNVEVEVVWWQKVEMFPAIQNTSIAGEGFPDIFQ